MSNRSTEHLDEGRAGLDLGESAAATALAAWQANATLRNACWLLLACLATALTATGLALALHLPPAGPLTGTGLAMALLWLTWRLRRGAWSLPAMLALACWTGYLLAPLLGRALLLPHGAGLVATGILGSLFLGAAILAYALASGRDFALLGGYVSIAIVTTALAGMAGNHHGSSLAMVMAATAMVLLLCAVLLHVAGMLASGRERNYVIGAAGLFVTLALLAPSLTASLALEDEGHNAVIGVLGLFVAAHALIRGLATLLQSGERPG